MSLSGTPDQNDHDQAGKLATNQVQQSVGSNDLGDDGQMATIDVHLTSFGDPSQKVRDLQKSTEFEFDDPDAPPVPTLAERLIGKTLGEYTVEAPIGRGGMGQVFRARHRMMDRLVALKVLPHDFASDRELVDRFFLEVKSLGKLLHPNIVTAFDAGQFEGLHYLVMELIEGQSLSQYVTTNGPCSIEKAIDILRQTSLALAYAHDRGLIHRDIKPSNLMITPEGTIKVLDFGLVRLSGRDQDDAADQKQRLMGTVEFMSPEQIRYASTIDYRSDLYSLGATFYYLLTAQTMFSGEPVQIAISHLNESPPLLFEMRGDVDLRIDGLFQKLVAKNPDDRFTSAHEVVRFIDENDLIRRTHAMGGSTVSIARELGKKLLDHPTKSLNKQSTTRRELGAIGIDLGMLHTQASGFDPADQMIPIKFADGRTMLENMLWSKQSKLLFGAAAEAARVKEPGFAFHSLQRWLGLQRIDRDFCGRQCPPEVILAAFLQHITQQARMQVKSLTHCVITIPSSYDQLRRIAISSACRIAGLEVLQLLDKHLAASLARIQPAEAIDSGDSQELLGAVGDPVQHLLVITLTGSAAEAAVVRVDGKRVQTLASVGDWQTGLLRWQARLADYFAADIYKQTKKPVREDIVLASRVQRLVERTLQSVFASGAAVAKLRTNNLNFEWQINTEKLLTLCHSENSALERYIETSLERAKVDIQEIDEVLLIGDSLKSLHLSQRRRTLLGRKIREVFMTQAELARGASLQCNYLLPPGNPDGPHAHGNLATDIGIALRMNKQFIHEPRVLLRRDTPTPTTHSRTLRLDRQPVDGLALNFLERPRIDEQDWNRLSSLAIAKSFPELNSNDPLQVRLRVDHSGIWSATLVDVARGAQLAVPPITNYSLSDEQIQSWHQWLETALLCNL